MLKISFLLSGLVLAVLVSLSSAKPATQSIVIKPDLNSCVCLVGGAKEYMEPCDAGACNTFCNVVHHSKGVCRFDPSGF